MFFLTPIIIFCGLLSHYLPPPATCHHPRCSVETHEGELCSVIAGPPEALSIDIICLQETHVDNGVASRFTINLSNLISCQSHAKHERVM